MIDIALIQYMQEELRRTPTGFTRYIDNDILWDARMIGLTGPRGVGKSTLVKQHILMVPEGEERDRWLYVTANHTYFATHTLAYLADEWVKDGGTHLIIDEIHTYPGWSQELKQIYDAHATLKIIFTGSSILDIRKGVADLSRRALMFHMQGLSFREYMKMFHNIDFPVYSLQDILRHKVTVPIDFHPLPYFRQYLKSGYFPFSIEPGYEIRLQQVISQTIEMDIPQFCNMNLSTARKLKRMLGIVAQSVPYKPNMTSLAGEIGVSKNDIPEYLTYLEMAGMLGLLRDDTGGFRGLGKVEKIYADNPNIMYALVGENANLGTIRETFFYNQMRVRSEITSSKITDFRIGDNIFEIGGNKKGKKQLQGISGGIVVRDDIEYGFKEFVPLWQFGLTY
ncbi:MAG: AAA family ATPase [Muribaculaceae bacterium]|nr:AAA family ATPase [Muribaculaceae bacterium]